MEDDEGKVVRLSVVADQPDIASLPGRVRFGVAVRQARLKAGVSLGDLAALIWEDTAGSKVVLGQLERGMRPPTQEEVEAIAAALHMDKDYLVGLARDYVRSVWSGQGVTAAGDPEVKVASLAPSAATFQETRDEVERLVADAKGVHEAIQAIGEKLQTAIHRARATLEDIEGPPIIEKPEDMPDDVKLGTEGWNPWPCPKCEGVGIDPDVKMVPDMKRWELRCEKCGGSGQVIPAFQVGHVYAHQTGRLMRVVGEVETTGYGQVLVGEESSSSNLIPLGRDSVSTHGWREVKLVTWYDHWLRSNPNDAALEQLREAAVSDADAEGR